MSGIYDDGATYGGDRSARDKISSEMKAGGSGDGPLVSEWLDAFAAEVRAATLREAADVAESLREFEDATGARKSAQVSENVGILRVVNRFRRMADGEEQP